MKALRVCTLVYLAIYLSVPAKTADLERRELEIAASIRFLREENKTFADYFDAEFATNVRTVRHAFVCPTLAPSPTVPTSVHRLRPSDVKIVAALGDSLTAGRAVTGGIIGLLIDYRGLSWSVGGDNDYYDMPTLPNILRIYNPNLYGYSQGVGSLKARFNIAKSGAKSGAILGQARELLQRMKEDKKVNFAEDWKLITIFIGGNDLCDWCEDEAEYSAARYKHNLQETLNYFSANFPRTFVNLVEVMRVDFVRDLAANPLCEAIHAFVCDCAANPKSEADYQKLIALREAYQLAARELAASSSYDTRDDFAVVLQPFYRNTTPPLKPDGDIDLSYFAADCFHLSKKGQTAAAEALWNNMIEPVGSKRVQWTPGEPIECPTDEHPFLYTAKNSNKRPRT